MSATGRNVVANLAGRFWSNLLSIAVVPLYLKFLGIESYGLIGIFATLQGIVALFDLGLVWVLMRELASLSAREDSAPRQRDLMRTVEWLYWAISAVSATLVVVLARPLASGWLNAEGLPPETVTSAVRLMALGVAFQFPFAIYQGALVGMQRQVVVNVILSVTGTLRAVGGMLLVWYRPDIVLFLGWQGVISFLSTSLVALYVWRVLPKAPERPVFRFGLVSASWRYAIGATLIALATTVLFQADKIVLSKMLTLTAFGYYTIAQSIAAVLWSVARPISSAVFPRFAQLMSMNDDAAVTSLYHRSQQIMSVLLGPAALLIVFFSYEMVLVWTHDPKTAQNTWLVAALCGVSTLGLGLGDIPHFTRLASGWVRLSLILNSVLIAVVIPSLALAARYYGAVGSAAVWASVSFVYMIASVTLMHRRMLQGELSRFLFRDTALPLAAATAVALIGRELVPQGAGSTVLVLSVGLVYVLMMVAAVAALPDLRGTVLQRMQALFANHVRNRSRAER
jgi:O-antigen/teichoic acid export membrane protein